MYFLNSGKGYKLFLEERQTKTYIDKTLLIDAAWRYRYEYRKYICITRPRRFGKTMAANMIAAFFDESTADSSRQMFEEMEIGSLKAEQERKWLEKKRAVFVLAAAGKMQGHPHQHD